MGKKNYISLFLILIPFLCHAQIERFKMYEEKPEVIDTIKLNYSEKDTLKNINYKLGYFDGKKYAEEKGSNNSSILFGPPVLETDELNKISSKQNKSVDYQLGFEDGYFGKPIKDENSGLNPEKADGTAKIALIIISIYLLIVFSPVILSFSFI